MCSFLIQFNLAITKTHSNEHLDTRGGGGAPIRNPDNGQLMATVSGRLANDDMVRTTVIFMTYF